VDQVPHLAERALMDRLDQQLHPLAQRGGFLDARLLADAAQRRMLGGAVLGRVDDVTREQLAARLREAGRVGERLEIGQQLVVEMGLGPVEQDAALLRPAQFEAGGVLFHAARIAGEQFGERRIVVQPQVTPCRRARFAHQIPLSYSLATRLGPRAMIANRKNRRESARLGRMARGWEFCSWTPSTPSTLCELMRLSAR